MSSILYIMLNKFYTKHLFRGVNTMIVVVNFEEKEGEACIRSNVA